MTMGRLIKIRRSPQHPEPAIYVVAELDPDKAITTLKEAHELPRDKYEDLGPVNDSLVLVLGLKPGEFTRI
jgi:hypothetical protein